MVRQLTEEDILRVMREEWDKRIKRLEEDVGLILKSKVDGSSDEKLVLSPELKVMHRSSGLKYTIDSVGPRDVILRTPEGETFLVDAETLEGEYELE